MGDTDAQSADPSAEPFKQFRSAEEAKDEIRAGRVKLPALLIPSGAEQSDSILCYPIRSSRELTDRLVRRALEFAYPIDGEPRFSLASLKDFIGIGNLQPFPINN